MRGRRAASAVFLAAAVAASCSGGEGSPGVGRHSHRFVHDQPLVDPIGQKEANVTRIETFGSPDVGWVEVALDPADPAAVRVEPRLVQGAPR